MLGYGILTILFILFIDLVGGSRVYLKQESSRDDIVIVHHHNTVILPGNSHHLHQALRRLGIITSQVDKATKAESAPARLPPEYAVNLMQPFGGASASASAGAHDVEKAKGSSLDKAESGTSAAKKADRGDIFYEKLIIFKTSHDRVKEQANADNSRLSKQEASRVADRGQHLQQNQQLPL